MFPRPAKRPIPGFKKLYDGVDYWRYNEALQEAIAGI